MIHMALRGRLPAKLVALVNISDCSQDTVQRLAGIPMLSPVNSRRPSDIHTLVTVQLRDDAREFTLVGIGTIHGLAHLIPRADPCGLVDSHIDLRTVNEIYYLSKWGYDGYVRRSLSGAISFCFFFFFIIMYSLFIVQETVSSASYGVNKTVNNPTTRFTPSWEKSNPSNPERTPPPNST